jgi:rSAM/selenodomain-associated transferase 1
VKAGLIVFAREPLPGQVKTRLAAEVGAQVAAEWYEQMLREVLRNCTTLAGIDTTVFWACDETTVLRLAEQYGCRSRQQASGDLGQRMAAAFAEMFAAGYEACCIIGSDAPDLPMTYLQSAYEMLVQEQGDVVYGPCEDGGYYLLGLKRVWPELFANISWSSDRVLEQSIAAAQEAGAVVKLLPRWHDIDTVEDLHAYILRNHHKES